MAEIRIGEQGSDLRSVLCLRGGDQTPHLLPRRDPQRPDTGLRLRRIIGEGEHGDVRRARHRRDRGGFGRGQRPQDQPGAVRDGCVGGGGGTGRRAARVLGVELRIRRIKSKLRGIQHGLADFGARARQRQQYRDPPTGRTRVAWLTHPEWDGWPAIASGGVSAAAGVEC